MKKLLLVYNPNSGDKSFKHKLDLCINVLQQGDFDVTIYRSESKEGIFERLEQARNENFHTVVACGGDGTVNTVVNGIMKADLDVRLGVIPGGTANDFATFLGMPVDVVEASRIINVGDTIRSDLGYVEGEYFINVCGAGLLTNISHNIDETFKNTLGNLAYYIKGIEQLQNFVPIPIRITNSKEIIEEDVYLLIVLNGAGAGSFENLASDAKLDDGLLDFIAFKTVPIKDLAVVFYKVLRGNYLDDPNVIFFQDDYIKIEYTGTEKDHIHPSLIEIGLDGERGPDMPIEIRNIPNTIDVYYNKFEKDLEE